MQHSAVNFALYERGVCTQGVLTEYPTARVADDGRTLRIGSSTLQPLLKEMKSNLQNKRYA